MKVTSKNIRYFLFSQYLADGIRITLEIILPVIIFAQFNRMDIGFIMATGALCVSVTDMPGPVEHKRNGMLYCIAFIFVMALLTGFLNQHTILLGLLIALSTFFFTMFSVYGIRAGLVGTAALLIMILRMSENLEPSAVFIESIYVLAGGIWYMLVALLFFRLAPFRPAQRALGECIHEIAVYLKIKSALYDLTTDYDNEYKNLLAQQVVVHEKQDAIRELLFKDKLILSDPGKTGKLLVLTFADTVDLYEQVMATWYDYKALRNKFGDTGLLQEVSEILFRISDELDRIGMSIQANSSYKIQYDIIPALDELKTHVDAIENNSNLVLKKILVNLRNLARHIDELTNYFSASISEQGKLRRLSDYAKFVSHQEIDLRMFRNNFHLESGVFRHALRMMITCVAGFAITKLIAYGEYNYWVLLTTIVILKPGFSLTRQRNMERLTGTIAGGLLGVLLLTFIHDRSLLYTLLIIFMIGTYSFQRSNYTLMVVFITPYILILFNLLGLGLMDVAWERLLDTAIASVLAFTANYLLFPNWESLQIDAYMKRVLQANIGYLQKLHQYFYGNVVSQLDYKLVRKELYVSTANLSAAFQRMLTEPKNKQKNEKLIYEFTVLNNVLASNIASISSNIKYGESIVYSKEITAQVTRSINNLQKSLLMLSPNENYLIEKPIRVSEGNKLGITDKHLSEQISFISKVSSDIEKITQTIFA